VLTEKDIEFLKDLSKEDLEYEMLWSSKKIQANTFFSVGLEKKLPNLSISKKLGFIKTQLIFNGTLEQVVYSVLNFDVSQPKLKYRNNVKYYNHKELLTEIKKLPEKLKWKSGNHINTKNGERTMAEIDYTYYVLPLSPMMRLKWVSSCAYDVIEEELTVYAKMVTGNKEDLLSNSTFLI
jgi:hypothetical protein